MLSTIYIVPIVGVILKVSIIVYIFYRHDEWIRHERIQSVISRPDMTKKVKKLLASQMIKDGSIPKGASDTKVSNVNLFRFIST